MTEAVSRFQRILQECSRDLELELHVIDKQADYKIAGSALMVKL